MVGEAVSCDPIGIKGELNLFAYTGNNPIRFIDSFGTKKEDRVHQVKRLRTSRVASHPKNNVALEGNQATPEKSAAETVKVHKKLTEKQLRKLTKDPVAVKQFQKQFENLSDQDQIRLSKHLNKAYGLAFTITFKEYATRGGKPATGDRFAADPLMLMIDLRLKKRVSTRSHMIASQRLSCIRRAS